MDVTPTNFLIWLTGEQRAAIDGPFYGAGHKFQCLRHLEEPPPLYQPPTMDASTFANSPEIREVLYKTHALDEHVPPSILHER